MILHVAVPAPLRKLFDYLPPASHGHIAAQPGQRVSVPFGSRTLAGIVVGSSDRAPDTDATTPALKSALGYLDEQPLLDGDQLELCHWAARYYQHPIGDVLYTGVPKALREGKPLPRTAWRLTQRGLGLADDALRRAPRQASVIRLLREEASCTSTTLREAGFSSAILRELVNKGLIECCTPPAGLLDASTRQSPPSLSNEQRNALAAIQQDLGFHCHLLEGVTGSGKTEVYLQLIESCLARGRQALVLIPEIGLTPQTQRRFADRFQAPVATLHSGLADGERLDAWAAARDGRAGIVLGTRSAVFTPMARLGLVIVDEEHDSSYKQQDGFRYSARDVAVKRAQLHDCPVVLGSATPSLETLNNVEVGRYRRSRMTTRVAGGAPPELRHIDLRGTPLHAGISDALLNAIRETTEIHREQVLLFLNRRGYAPALLCHDCGWVALCPHCEARQTVHLRRRQLRCHHCGDRSALPGACPQCHGRLLTRGLGTEQSEDYLRDQLRCPVHRIDSDSMQGRDAASTLLRIAESDEPCVLLGTQMLSKGHHFPRVQLVGIIDTDALLYSTDFRGEERLAQLVIQVSGRAGRERQGGRVLLQTHHPEHPLLDALSAGGYPAVTLDMLSRRRSAGLPPFGQLSLLRCDSREENAGEAFLHRLRRAVEGELPREVSLIGPLPSSLPRRAGRFRWQLWCLSRDRATAQGAAARLVEAAQSLKQTVGLKWFLDVDPQDVA